MAWSVLQSAGTSVASGTTIAVTFASMTSGSKIIAYVEVDGTTVSTVKDTAGNSLGQLTALTSNTTSGYVYALDTPAGDLSGTTITATFAAGSNGGTMVVQEVSGLLAGSSAAVIYDGTAGTATGTGTNPSFSATLGAYTSHALNEYLVAVGLDNGDVTGNTWNTPTGYTADAHNENNNADGTTVVYYKNSTNAAESPASLSVNPCGGNTNYVTVFVAFKLPAVATVAGTVQPQPTFPLQRRKLSRVLWHGGTGFNRPAGTTQPTPTLTPPRRHLSRVLWAGSKPFLGFTPGTTQPRPTVPIPRRTPARAVVQFKPVTTTNAVAAHVAGTQQPQTTLTWPRRRLNRAVIQFTPVRTTNAVVAVPNGQLQPRATVLIPRRTPARAFIRFTPLIAVNAIPPPALSPLGAGGSIEGELWRMYRDNDWPKRPPGFGPVGQVPTVSTRPEEHSGRGWVGKKVRRFFWPREDD